MNKRTLIINHPRTAEIIIYMGCSLFTGTHPLCSGDPIQLQVDSVFVGAQFALVTRVTLLLDEGLGQGLQVSIGVDLVRV